MREGDGGIELGEPGGQRELATLVQRDPGKLVRRPVEERCPVAAHLAQVRERGVEVARRREAQEPEVLGAEDGPGATQVAPEASRPVKPPDHFVRQRPLNQSAERHRKPRPGFSPAGVQIDRSRRSKPTTKESIP